MMESIEVRDVIWHTSEIFELQCDRADWRFTPGDCVALYGADGQASRPYSFASGAEEPCLRFLIRRMEGGEVSPFLASRRSGDVVRMSPPFGWFRPGQAGHGAPAVFVATGTGIAPFLSYLRTGIGAPPQICLYGVRRRQDAVAVEWLRETCPVRLAVSREAVPDAHHGRVTDLCNEIPLTPGIHYYLCGLDAMIDEIMVWLEQKGVDITRVHRECFFNANP